MEVSNIINQLNNLILYWNNVPKYDILIKLFPEESADYIIQKIDISFDTLWSKIDDNKKYILVDIANKHYNIN